MEARRDVFQAIADPTRRQIIALLAGKPMNLNDLAENFEISRPAISQQVKILAECGLVQVKRIGRESHCKAKLEKLREVRSWVEQYREYWDSKFDSLEKYLHKIQQKRKSNGKN